MKVEIIYQDLEITQIEVIDSHKTIIHALEKQKPLRCPSCNGDTFYKYGQKTLTIKDVPTQSELDTFTPQQLLITRKRYRCNTCRSVFCIPTSQIRDINNDFRITENLLAFIEEHLHFTSVKLAQITGVKLPTMRLIVKSLKNKETV